MKFIDALKTGLPIRLAFAWPADRRAWFAVGEDGDVVNLDTAKPAKISRDDMLRGEWEAMDEAWHERERERIEKRAADEAKWQARYEAEQAADRAAAEVPS